MRKSKIHKYKPDNLPKGCSRIEREKCNFCLGTKYYSGRYGPTACEKCHNGYVWREIRKYNKTKQNQLNKKDMEIDWKGKLKPRPNDYYESAAEMIANDNYWLKKYKRDLEDWKKVNIQLTEQNESMDAKTFLIQQHRTGEYDDIKPYSDCIGPYSDYANTDYGSRFWSAIVRLLENYAKVALDIPVRKKQCMICGIDITEFDNYLFCSKCEKPNNQICPYCGKDELGFDNGKLRCLCCKKFINN